jgi:hypothetical protein
VIAGKAADSDIRVWSAGCASGEEAFTLAILLAELVGDGFRDRVKIYATDVVEAALSEAAGVLTQQQVEALRRAAGALLRPAAADSHGAGRQRRVAAGDRTGGADPPRPERQHPGPAADRCYPVTRQP